MHLVAMMCETGDHDRIYMYGAFIEGSMGNRCFLGILDALFLPQNHQISIQEGQHPKIFRLRREKIPLAGPQDRANLLTVHTS